MPVDPLKIFFVLDEAVYHPALVAQFIQKSKDQIVGAVIVTQSPARSSFEDYFIKHWYCFRVSEVLRLLWLKYSMKLKGIVSKKDPSRPFYSLKSVLNFYKINYFYLNEDINKEKYLEKIKAQNPDVIVSSNPYIFKKKLLNLPNICCLNRHFGLLPSYRGLLATFHAFRNGEQYTGCSIHIMDEKLDHGPVLSQQRIQINRNDTLHELHLKCFAITVDCLMEALDKIRQRDFTAVINNYSPSYFSFPNNEQWKQFRQKGGRII